MKKQMTILLLSAAALALWGCGKKKEETTGEVAVPQVQIAESAVTQTEEQREASLGLETETGTVLGEEEVTVILEGMPETKTYTRIQGNGEFTIAYDPETFSVRTEGEDLYLNALSFAEEGEKPAVFIRIGRSEAESMEELVDTYVYESNEECTVEEVTIGEGEYPATWIGYTEGMDSDSRTCDIYVLRVNGKLYVIQLDCFMEALEGLGALQQTILSTLRFDEG